MYRGIVEPHFRYYRSVWGGALWGDQTADPSKAAESSRAARMNRAEQLGLLQEVLSASH